MSQNKIILGWREWLFLPTLTDIAIQAKVDTGAKTSALHAFYINPVHQKGQLFIEFHLHPHQKNKTTVVKCFAPVEDQREVTDSGGHKEVRYVIRTQMRIGNLDFDEELTLTDRDTMKFRMLLGRNALKERFLVDSSLSFQLGGNRISSRPALGDQ